MSRYHERQFARDLIITAVLVAASVPLGYALSLLVGP